MKRNNQKHILLLVISSIFFLSISFFQIVVSGDKIDHKIVVKDKETKS